MTYIPKPFKRPSIELNSSGRQWTDAPVHSLSEGDNLLGMGVIQDIDADLFEYRLTFINGRDGAYEPDTIVRAFTVVN